MKNILLKIGMLSLSAMMFTACGGGGGGDNPPPTTNNAIPIADAGSDISILGTKKATLDASASSDDKGIVSYEWKEGTRLIGSSMVVNNVSFTDGEHTVTLTVKDTEGKASTDSITVNAQCTMAGPMELTKDVNGTVNFVGENDKTTMCSKINLSSNNGIETYTFYMNLLPGTGTFTQGVYVALIDEDGIETPLSPNTNGSFYKEGQYIRKTFTISTDGDYYIKTYRRIGATKYAFSMHPSLVNGLVQNTDKELNDNESMAAPITLSETMTDINGTLHMTRSQDNSLKGTDDTDYYSINIADAGTYTFYMNLLPGTGTYTQGVYVTLIDENGVETPLSPNTNGSFYKEGQYIRKAVNIASGTYFIKIYRRIGATKYAFSMHPSLVNGLVQNTDKELNDNESMAAPITLNEAMNDISGSLHMTRTKDNSLKGTDDTDYYSINMTDTGTYTFYMNLFDGTTAGIKEVYVTLIDENGVDTPITANTNGSFNESGDNFRKTFSISSIGTYYIKISRKVFATKYTFSIHPSLLNGLVQNSDKELNDNESMAAPVTLSADIDGSLHMTRNQDNSLKGTDDTDYYSININTGGTYTFDMSLLSGTIAGIKGVYVTLIDENGVETPLSPNTNGSFYKEGQSISKDVTVGVGTYYIKIYRKLYVTKYTFNMHP